jgi:flagellin
MRQRTVAAANVGVNDENMISASQREVEQALDSIDRIAENTQFAGMKLLKGEDESAAPAEAAASAEAAGGGSNSSKALTFQIGANQGQTETVMLPNVLTKELAKGVQNDGGFASLADIDVSAPGSAMAVIDKAIGEITTYRGNLGAFQKNTLESNLTSLRVATENLTAAESNIRDADIAVELAAFTRNQIMTQSATAQLAQANAMPQNVARLLSAQ